MARETMATRIQRGVALLDEKAGVGWVHHIDLPRLDLADANQCVLGELYETEARQFGMSGYGLALWGFYGGPDTVDPIINWYEGNGAADYGFCRWDDESSYDNLTRAWKRKIRQLQKERE